MDTFENDSIDTAGLPKFEDVALTKLSPEYFKVMLINSALFLLLLAVIIAGAMYMVKELRPYKWMFAAAWFLLLAISFASAKLSMRTRGFAFRLHDAIYKSGIISSTTTIIPYNRVQHVTLHEGLIARWFGLAAIEIYTAGGKQSDIEIKGIEKRHAEKIKQLLIGKVSEEDGHY